MTPPPAPPTRAEFESEARRILAAFGQKSDGPLKIKHQVTTTHLNGTLFSGTLLFDPPITQLTTNQFTFNFAIENFAVEKQFVEIQVLREMSPLKSVFSLQMLGNTGEIVKFFHLIPINHPTRISLSCKSNLKEHLLLMLYALYRLGYDLDPLCEQVRIQLTTHELLEWHLQCQQASKNQTQPFTNRLHRLWIHHRNHSRILWRKLWIKVMQKFF